MGERPRAWAAIGADAARRTLSERSLPAQHRQIDLATSPRRHKLGHSESTPAVLAVTLALAFSLALALALAGRGAARPAGIVVVRVFALVVVVRVFALIVVVGVVALIIVALVVFALIVVALVVLSALGASGRDGGSSEQASQGRRSDSFGDGPTSDAEFIRTARSDVVPIVDHGSLPVCAQRIRLQ